MKRKFKSFKRTIKKSTKSIFYDKIDNAPWLKYYEELKLPNQLIYPKKTLYEVIYDASLKYPNRMAYEYFGKNTTYKEFLEKVHRCAKSFQEIGVKENDFVTICTPNVPEGIIAFYALNLIGAISNMTHPLSSEAEIEFYLKKAKSKYIVTMDFVYDKLKKVEKNIKLDKIILIKASDSMNTITSVGYWFKGGRKIKVTEKQNNVLMWKDFFYLGRYVKKINRSKKTDEDLAVILYSGGTTGTPKGIKLTSRNFNVVALQNITICPGVTENPPISMLAIMPIFHGFGLGICFHAVFTVGGKSIVIPKFSAETFGKLIKTYRPNFIAGVPTLYEALTQTKLKENDLSFVTSAVCGGDMLSPELQERINNYLKDHGSNAEIQAGWGMTECVASTIMTPHNNFVPGSIGIPGPDNLAKVVKPGTTESLPYDEEGELCLNSPAVMLGYLDDEEETKKQLQTHEDGKLWLHTGDIVSMDKTGMVFFKSRLKRIIISSGYNIYPNHVEAMINQHPKVLTSIVVGKPHKYKGETAVAYVVLKPEYKLTDEIDQEIKEHCKQKIAKYSLPSSIEYRETLPMTKVGKIDYRNVK